MTTDQLHLLFAKWLDKSISAEEQTVLMAALREADPAVMEQLVAESFDAAEVLFEQAPEKAETIYRHITSHSPARKPRLIQMPWLRYAVVLLLLAGIGMYGWFRERAAPKSADTLAVKQALPADAAPGHDGAVLTLADGSRMIFEPGDSNGTVAKQKGTQLYLKNGQLIYNADHASGTSYNTITTPKGRQFGLQLPDGSHVWLNAASSLRYPTVFEGNERSVEVTGEAYFEIAQQATMPFKVTVNGTEIRVLGTSFNMNAYADEPVIKTTLQEGLISLSAGQEPLLLHPGQQAQLPFDPAARPGDRKIQLTTANVNMEEVMAWRKGVFYLSSADIPTVMRQLSRWYNLDVVFKNGIPQGHLSGKTQRSLQLSQVLKVMELSGVHVQLEENKLIVSP
jgi:ferric-dicitrate binding protein FerR (iron transport regulator)